MKKGCPSNLLFILEKAPPETALAMAECYVKSPARTFFSPRVQPGKGGAVAHARDGRRTWKKTIPAESSPFSLQKHPPPFLQSHPCLAPLLHPPPFPNPQAPETTAPLSHKCPPSLRMPSYIIADMASESWRHSCVSHITEILPFQLGNSFMSKSDFEFFFFIVSTHVFFKNVFVSPSLSPTLPLLTLKSR